LVRHNLALIIFSVLAWNSSALAGEFSTPDRQQNFKNTYEESRTAFLASIESLKKTDPKLQYHAVPVPTSTNETLVMDVAYLPPVSGKKDRLLILTSGMHGMEGSVGSALQNQFIRENFWQLRDENLGILFIHAVNPYGFKFHRRVTENNVDLNRNFDVTPALFEMKNEGYDKIKYLLNPSTPSQSGLWDRLRFYASCVKAIAIHSMDSLRRAILRGQYHDADGIYFGGKNFEPQKNLLEKEILAIAPGYDQTLLIDLHTGYGRRGHLHLFADQIPEMDSEYLQKIFAGYDLNFGQQKDFYVVSGGFVVFGGRLLSGKTRYAGMVFEFGTLDSQTTLGSLDSLYRMVRENQGVHHGTKNKADQDENTRLFQEMFYPKDPQWRETVSQQFQDVLSLTLKNQKALK